MNYQLLVSAVNQSDCSLYDNMNIHSDAIIVNQSDKHSFKTLKKDDYDVIVYNFDERGVGLSRNTALMRATADIVEFADDDMIFTDTHQRDVLKVFEEHPEADAILFSVESLNIERPSLKIKKFKRVSKIEALKYGCARLAVKREKIIYNNITFSLLFGGGARYGSGEDTLFLQDCIRSGIKIYKSPVKIANVKQEESSWFNGYNQKYYTDKGALCAAIFPRLCYLYAILKVIRLKSKNYSKLEIFQMYLKGISDFKTRRG